MCAERARAAAFAAPLPRADRALRLEAPRLELGAAERAAASQQPLRLLLRAAPGVPPPAPAQQLRNALLRRQAAAGRQECQRLCAKPGGTSAGDLRRSRASSRPRSSAARRESMGGVSLSACAGASGRAAGEKDGSILIQTTSACLSAVYPARRARSERATAQPRTRPHACLQDRLRDRGVDAQVLHCSQETAMKLRRPRESAASAALGRRLGVLVRRPPPRCARPGEQRGERGGGVVLLLRGWRQRLLALALPVGRWRSAATVFPPTPQRAHPPCNVVAISHTPWEGTRETERRFDTAVRGYLAGWAARGARGAATLPPRPTKRDA